MPNASVINYNDPFPSSLRGLMDEQKTTQKQLAEYIGVSRQSISQYMDGSVQPVATKLAAIADYFHVTADYLLGRTGAKRAENINAVDKYGLSEAALDILADRYSQQKNNSITFALNALIENKQALGAIATYLYYNLRDEDHGEMVPYRLEYRYRKDGDDGGWGAAAKRRSIDIGDLFNFIDNQTCKKILLLQVQEQLHDLLQEEDKKDRLNLSV